MKDTRVIAIRHGETVWNLEGREMGQKDSPLTPKGGAQADALSTRLAGVTFQALYSSDLGRALDTARCIAKKHEIDVVPDARLRERNMGIFEGLTIPEMREQHPDVRREYEQTGGSFVIPNGESGDQRQARSVACFEELAQRHVGETIVIVTHGGVLAGVFQHVLGLPFESGRSFKRSNASLSVFLYRTSGWFLETWNDTSHLQEADVLDDMIH